MQRTHTSFLALVGLFVAAVALAACGGGQASPGSTAQVAAATLAGTGCETCHGADGSGGIGPDIRCATADMIAANVRPADTQHFGGSFPNLTDADSAAIAAALDTGSCTASSGPPASHTVPKGSAGILHHPDYRTPMTTCVACHGANLEGSGAVPSCTTCHGVVWDGGGVDSGTNPDDDDCDEDDDHDGDHDADDGDDHGGDDDDGDDD